MAVVRLRKPVAGEWLLILGYPVTGSQKNFNSSMDAKE